MMVSIGTIISIAVAGAIGIAGYVLYSNRDQVGSALSRGVKNSISVPFGNYFNTLFTDAPSSPRTAIPNIADTDRGPTSEQLEKQRLLGIAQAQLDFKIQYGQEVITYEDTLDVYKDQINKGKIETDDYGIVGPLDDDFTGEDHRGANPLAPDNEPLFAPSPAGYYYYDFANQKDRQVFLPEGLADEFRATNPGYGVHYLAPTKIGDAGFVAYGNSKGYI